MNKSKRDIYIKLADAVDRSICQFCKTFEGDCYSNGCTHPLQHRFNNETPDEPNSDCWGFRPEFNVSTTADIVGIILANGWDYATWYYKENQLIMKGGSER